MFCEISIFTKYKNREGCFQVEITKKLFMLRMNLSIATVNVRGLAQDVKRRKMFHYFHCKEIDIVMLQETHSCKSKSKIWKSEWGGCAYFSHGDTNARDVAILIRKNVEVKVIREHKDKEGRILILEIVSNNMNFTLVNVYAPNSDRPEFIEQVFSLIDKSENSSIIMGGDLNLVMDIKKDKLGGTKITHFKSVYGLKEFMKGYKLKDIWRDRNPTNRSYTWFQ